MQKKARGRPRSAASNRSIAETMNISERMLYYSKELRRSGREDLILAVAHGKMTIAAAIREVRGTTLPDRYTKLVQAWKRCSDNEQARFLVALANAGLVTLSNTETME